LTSAPLPRGHWSPLWIVFLALSLSLLLASSFPLVDPDEGRNAEVAREMLVTHDVVVPHLAGMPYLDKPPALFWAAALAMAVGGVTPLAARFPSALAAALTLALLARAAERRGGTAFAVRATALLATAPLFAALSAYVIFDMPLTLCVSALWFFISDEVDEGPSTRRRLLLFAAVTIGVLLKGPVMLAWAIGGSLGAAFAMQSRAPLRWLSWLPGWAMVFGIAGGWFALASRRFPEYPHYAFLEESLERIASGSFKREQPWWFAPIVLAAGTLPWSIATPWGRRDQRENADEPRRARIATVSRVALGFVLFAVVFFTLSHSKLVTYLLPALPPLAWLAAEAWSDVARERSAGLRVAVVYGLLSVACIAVAFVPQVHSSTGEIGVQAAKRLAIAFAGCAMLGLLAVRAGRRTIALLVAVAFTPLVFVIAGPALQASAEQASGASLARAIARTGPGARVRFEFCYSPGVDVALGRRSEIVSPLGFETTSTYQVRYRDALIARGLWTPLAAAPAADSATIVVRPAHRAGLDPLPGGVEIFRDRRFVAYRI
jgi:4-amino-4-deoxy-L-arabinose transferase-like glycosyltransferase